MKERRGYVRNCRVELSPKEETGHQLFDDNSGVSYLDGYAVIPKEKYDRIMARLSQLGES